MNDMNKEKNKQHHMFAHQHDELEEEAIEFIQKCKKARDSAIHGQYSREYTDYFIGQLADVLGFDIFHEKLSNLKIDDDKRFKPYREYIESPELDEKGDLRYPSSLVSSLAGRAECCQDGIKSVERFQDMMYFDGLIMNNKRSLDSFGFIVDKGSTSVFKEIKYAFVCFYDDYNSFFDHLNGITLDDWYYAQSYIPFWVDSPIEQYYMEMLTANFVQERYLEKLEKLAYLRRDWKFQETAQFQLDNYVYIKELDISCSIYEYHIWKEVMYAPANVYHQKVNRRVFEKLKENKFDLSVIHLLSKSAQAEILKNEPVKFFDTGLPRQTEEHKQHSDHLQKVFCRIDRMPKKKILAIENNTYDPNNEDSYYDRT